MRRLAPTFLLVCLAGCATAPVHAPLPERMPERPIPWIHHPPLDAAFQISPPLPEDLRVRRIDVTRFRGLARLLGEVANVSSLTYDLEPGGALPGDASDALLGPIVAWPAGARPFAIVARTAGGEARVVDRMPGASADLMIEAELASRDGAYQAALERYREATRVEPGLAKAWVYRAEDAAATGHLEEARRAITRALALTRIDPMAHAVDAELALASGDRVHARRALAFALALYPGFPPARRLVEAVTGAPLTFEPLSPPAYVAKQQDGRIVVQADARRTDAWLTWALCEAVSRYDHDRHLFAAVGHGPGLQIDREMACGMVLGDVAMKAKAPGDPRVARIARIARAGDLEAFVLYDVIAPRMPSILLMASPEARKRLVDYVERFVLPKPEAATSRARSAASTRTPGSASAGRSADRTPSGTR